MEIKKELIKREVAGEVLLIPVGTSVYDTNGIFVLTELSAFIWDLLPRVNTIEEIVDEVLSEYEVDRETATKDIEEFLEKLKEHKII